MENNVSSCLKSLFSSSKIVWEILRQLVYNLYFTKYQILFYLLQVMPALKPYIKFESIMSRIVAELHWKNMESSNEDINQINQSYWCCFSGLWGTSANDCFFNWNYAQFSILAPFYSFSPFLVFLLFLASSSNLYLLSNRYCRSFLSIFIIVLRKNNQIF